MKRPPGQWLSERLGQQFLIDNRSGASGSIATDTVVREDRGTPRPVTNETHAPFLATQRLR
jgi:tripartite-type tricarboxylate transporter receptor subunit TctC